MEVSTALESLLEYYEGIKHQDVNRVAEKLYQLRVMTRDAPSSLPWLNSLLRNRIHDLGHHINPMYMDLLARRLDRSQLERFISEYYWGSGYGFQREVINLVYKSTTNQPIREYLKVILREEQKPRPHYIIFQEFIAAIGMQILPRKSVSVTFVRNQHDGYSGNMCHAFGYALGIEVEADFQIALLTCALSGVYPDVIVSNEFFEIHVDTSGEEAHAKETCIAIEKMVHSERDIEAVTSGFDTAILDTNAFMRGIRATLQ